MAEIRIERTRSNARPWLLGLALLALVILGLFLALADGASATDAGGAREVGTTQEEEAEEETPRRLQQWALALRTAPSRAA